MKSRGKFYKFYHNLPQEKPSQKPVSGEETETATGELLKAQHGGACEVKTARQPIPRKPPHFYCLSAEL